MLIQKQGYLHYLEETCLTEDEKFELIKTIWKMVNMIFDQSLGAYA